MAENLPTESAESSQSSVSFDNLPSISLDSESDSDGGAKVEETDVSDTPPDEQGKVQENETAGNTSTDTDGDGEIESSDDADESDEDSDEDSAKSDEDSDTPTEEGAKAETKPPKFVWEKFRKLDKLDKDFLTPLRDANTPPGEVFQKLMEYAPTSVQNIAQEAAKHSVGQYPNEWLNHILGTDGETVESVKARMSNAAPDKAQTDSEQQTDFISIADTPEGQEVVEYYTSRYGEDWRNPVNDGDILDEDLAGIRVLRTNLANEAAQQKRIAEMQSKIDELAPTVQQIQEQQKTQEETEIENAYQAAASAYEEKVRTRAVQSVFQKENLLITESDDEISKALKEQVASAFEPYAKGIPSRFDDFLAEKFSDRENLGKVIRRVDTYIKDAAELDYQAKKEKDSRKAESLRANAATLRGHASDEEATIAVLGKKAAKEYLDKEAAPLKRALEEISRLRKQLKGNVRPEITSTGAAGAGAEEAVTFANIGAIPI